MPTYDYECRECGHMFEAFHGIKDEPLRTCPECGNDALERLIGGGAGIIFKGSGFYETDYKDKGSSCGCGSGSDSQCGTQTSSDSSDSSTSSSEGD